ncbi:hypothetical protein AB6A40_006788 [Gnathostoma spinigerum]|uniref:Alpha-type protein kinase domain-containing protein n=1 Tax=Gnathostoma spinigerum TaxID=75299 RepID=A0ABD6EPI5_9BILA
MSESRCSSSEWNALVGLCDDNNLSEHDQKIALVSRMCDQVVPSKLNHHRSSSESGRICFLMQKWKHVAKRCTKIPLPDPWLAFNFGNLPVRKCIRHRYSSLCKEWKQDVVRVKLHPEPFARGAMRECYRLKKLSENCGDDWSHAFNYVAKKYVRNVDRTTVFEDVKLQMDSKLWAEEFNRHNPPKKIDIFQMSVLEFVDSEDHSLYHLEHFIEGEYVKYNSNSGYVTELARSTPQAFSHFTFERSGHQLIVVDIQGVDDLYTDPQIHTADGNGYGDGNLGTKGMALFFHSHLCNEICHNLCLTEFDLAPNEKFALENGFNIERIRDAGTKLTENSDLPDPCSSIISDSDKSAMECLRVRTISSQSGNLSRHCATVSDASSITYDDRECGPVSHGESCVCDLCLDKAMSQLYTKSSDHSDLAADEELDVEDSASRRAHSRYASSSSCCSSRHTRDNEQENFWAEVRKMSRPAGFLSKTELQQLIEFSRQTYTASTLGQIHLDLARYHELGRFSDHEMSSSDKRIISSTNEAVSLQDKTSVKELKYDRKSALFHLDVARRCGVLEAILTMAEMAYNMPHDLLKDVEIRDWWDVNDSNVEEFGLDLMETAADMGNRFAMLFIAEAYETGLHLGPTRSPSWPRSVEWYTRVATQPEAEVDGLDGSLIPPRYEILKKMAEMYRQGGCGLCQDFHRAYELFTEAAEAAMTDMHGKIASKLYELAEQCAS